MLSFLPSVTAGSIFSLSLTFFFVYPCNSERPPAEEVPAEETGPGGLTDADIESNWEEAIEAFDAMELPEELLRGIYAYGFEKPSAIQQRAIKPTILGKDLIAQAQSGTVSQGKIVIVIERDEDYINTIFRV